MRAHTYTHCAYTQGHILEWHHICLTNTIFSVQNFNASGSIKIIAWKKKSLLIRTAFKKREKDDEWKKQEKTNLNELITSVAGCYGAKNEREVTMVTHAEWKWPISAACCVCSVQSWAPDCYQNLIGITEALRLRRARGSLPPEASHMIRELAAPVCRRSRTEQLYTRLTTRAESLVFISVQKYYIYIYNH